jgi:hypothetical protein
VHLPIAFNDASSQLTTVQRTYTQIFNGGEDSVQIVGSDSPVKRTHALVSAISIGHLAPLTVRLPGRGTGHLTLSRSGHFSVDVVVHQDQRCSAELERALDDLARVHRYTGVWSIGSARLQPANPSLRPVQRTATVPWTATACRTRTRSLAGGRWRRTVA